MSIVAAIHELQYFWSRWLWHRLRRIVDPDPQAEQLPQSNRPEIEQLGLTALVLVILGSAVAVGMSLAFDGVGGTLSELNHRHQGSLVDGVEFFAFVFATGAAAWLRPCAGRIRALRDSWLGPFLPLLMAASLAGMSVYLIWSGQFPQAEFGPDPFGFARWLGTILAIAFPFIWLPLFPRLTAILAGMIAGPAVVAIFGHLFLESLLGNGEECYNAPLAFSLLAPQIGFVLLSRTNPIWLAPGTAAAVGLLFTSVDNLAEQVVALNVLAIVVLGFVAIRSNTRVEAHPLVCAVVSGLLGFGMAMIGADFGYSCITLY